VGRFLPILDHHVHLGAVVNAAECILWDLVVGNRVHQGPQDGPRGNDHGADLDPAAGGADLVGNDMVDEFALAG